VVNNSPPALTDEQRQRIAHNRAEAMEKKRLKEVRDSLANDVFDELKLESFGWTRDELIQEAKSNYEWNNFGKKAIGSWCYYLNDKKWKFNWQLAINPISKKLYQQIIGEDLTSEEGEIDTVNQDNFDPKFINSLFSRGNLNMIRAKFFLRYLSLFILAFAIAGLKTGTTVKPVERKGIDIIFCIDVSTSMNAQDVKPSRIDKVKFEISKVVDGLKGDRLGIVVFSGSNFLYLPLTMDYDAAKLFVKSIDTEMISSKGTAIGQAIETSIIAFEEDGDQQKMIFLFSDGEDHSSSSLDAIARVLSEDIVIHVVGVGSVEGSLIPDEKRENVFLKDESGTLIMSKLNDIFLSEIAQTGKGNFFRIANSESVSEEINDTISKGEASLISSYEFAEYDHKYQYPLFFAIFFLFIAYILPSGRKRK
jgi:Ca-activated chloride channel family protein